MPERRELNETRERIDQLVKEWHEAVEALDRRYRRVAGAALLSVVVTLVAVVVGGLMIRAESSDTDNVARDAKAIALRVERVEASQDVGARAAVVDACRKRNSTNRALIGFLRKTAPVLVPLGHSQFPVERDCATYADQILAGEIKPQPERTPAPKP